jgi:hypothetical protein
MSAGTSAGEGEYGYQTGPKAEQGEGEAMSGDSWRALGWSFLASGGLTVCLSTLGALDGAEGRDEKHMSNVLSPMC